jgi:pimeloyl-ACP methyl ester carboxylesterase
VPFASREAAVSFFRGPSVSADAWAAGLEKRDGGWWPTFEIDVMTRTLRQAIVTDYWDEWERIRCPTLIVRAGAGQLTAAQAQEMVGRLPHADLAELPDAARDLHLDQPSDWRDAVAPILPTLK